MSEALVLKSDQDAFTQQQLAALKALGVEQASQGDLMLFLNQAQRTGLDPFSKQIYMLARRQKVGDSWVVKQTIQVGIDGFRLIARRAADAQHERFSMDDTLWADPNGAWHDMWIWDTPPLAAKVTVYRGDGKFSAVAAYREYVGTRFDRRTGQQVPNSMWAGKPALMLAKCAEALALRKAFPQELSGLYTSDEMQQADSDVQTPPVQQQDEQQAAQPVEMLASKQQAAQIMRIMQGCGVDSADAAAYVLTRLTGNRIDSTDQLSQADAEAMLSVQSLLVSRTKEFLNEYRKEHS